MEELLIKQHNESAWYPPTPTSSGGIITPSLTVSSIDAAAIALARLWHEQELLGTPLISCPAPYNEFHRHAVALLLDKVLEEGKRSAHPRRGQLDRWERLPAPAHAPVAQVPITGPFFEGNLLAVASSTHRHSVVGPVAGWYRYDFTAGWSALSVVTSPDNEGEAQTVIAIPDDKQDDWRAFLTSLAQIHKQIVRKTRRGHIQMLGEGQEIESHIIKTTFEDVLLPQEILDAVAAQRRIFTKDILDRLKRHRIPRMRRVLLIGPPGTGKTTLLKAEAAHHAKKRGLVFYLSSGEKQGCSWRSLLYALHQAAESRLPTLILIEDFEMFIADSAHPQRVLNIFDGVETPDNPAGTLLLMTSNDASKIDPRLKDRPGRIDSIIHIGPIESEDLVVRFLKRYLEDDYREDQHAVLAKTFLGQTGSHLQQVCLQGTIHATCEDRDEIEASDLLWAHNAILHGRKIAADPKNVAPPPTQPQGGYFGK